ncbi:MAG: sigma-70 family RNA polymerase sigma factor [Sphingobacteriaceae bacterium]|nr:sigma-70 family RNA polymerase sigma factor [Cytophagaceae bacterium]
MSLQDEFIERVQAHRALLNKLVYLYADEIEDRKDLHQEILLQAWRSYPTFRNEARFSTWLYRIGLNVSLTMLDRSKRTRTQELVDTPQSQGNEFESDDHLRHVLRQFGPVDRTLVVMTMEGYSPDEISETLGISPGNVRTKLHRLRQKIEQLWT